MLFLELPREVLDLVFSAMVRENISEAFSARAVSHLIKRDIETDLITNTPLSDMLTYQGLSKSIQSWIEKEENAYAFLEYRIEQRPGRPDGRGQLPAFIEIVINELMQFAPADANISKFRKQYQTDLLRVLASKRCIANFITRNWSDYDDVEGGLKNTFNESASRFVRGERSSADLLAAAAAVENISALTALLDKPEMLLDDCIFSNALHAAVIGDKTKSVQLLLERWEPYIPLTNAQQSFHEWLPSSVHDTFYMAISLGKANTANTLMDFLVKYGWIYTPNDVDVMGIIERAMAAGSIEIFEHTHRCIPNINKLPNYFEHLWLGFESSCREGHGEFVRHLVANDRVPPVQVVAGEVVIWTDFNHWDWYEVQNPLLAAAEYSRLPVLEALLQHDPALINFPGLLETAVLGTTRHDGRYIPFDYKDHRKMGSRHAVTHFLFTHGYPVTGRTIQLTNYFAKMYLAQDWVTGDFSMTLIILLINLKAHFEDKKLRKQMHVPVKRAVKRILDVKPDMRPLGMEGYSFHQSAEELNFWFEKHR